MYWMTLPLRRYADFSGRSRRREYWMFTLGYLIVATVLGVGAVVFGAFGSFGDRGGLANGLPFLWLLLLGLVGLALVVPSVAVQVRRFHDQDRAGWLVLLGFIPYIGGLIVILFMCRERRGRTAMVQNPRAQMAVWAMPTSSPSCSGILLGLTGCRVPLW